NFIMKVDKATLPPDTVFTTVNPLVRRITPGLPVRFDFGVKLPTGLIEGGMQEMEVEISEIMFMPDSADVRKEYAPAIAKIVEHVRSHPTSEVVISANGSGVDLAYNRAKAVRNALMAELSPAEGKNLIVTLKDNLSTESGTILSLGMNPTLGSILFENDQSNIRPQYNVVIDNIAADVEKMAKLNMPIVINIVGYTDRRGTSSYNESLGLRRAKSVYDAVAAKLSVEARSKLRVELVASPQVPVGQSGEK
ncbi:MAG: OmpA family protein, partial [Arenimonas sp.]|nr:OmpA family protein [Arenimonas sp.]